MLTKLIACQWAQKIYFNMWCQTQPIPARTQMYLNMRWPKPSHASEDTKCIIPCNDQTHPMITNAWEDIKSILTCVDQTHPIPARTPNVLEHVMTKPFPCQRRQKLSQHASTELLTFQGAHKMHMTCWKNQIHGSETIKFVLTCVDQTRPIPPRLQDASQH